MGLARLNRGLGGLAIVPCVFLHGCNLSEKRRIPSGNDTQKILVVVRESNRPLPYGHFPYHSSANLFIDSETYFEENQEILQLKSRTQGLSNVNLVPPRLSMFRKLCHLAPNEADV